MATLKSLAAELDLSDEQVLDTLGIPAWVKEKQIGLENYHIESPLQDKYREALVQQFGTVHERRACLGTA